MQIEFVTLVTPLPNGIVGYAATLDRPLEYGHIDALGRIQGYYHRSATPPKLRFSMCYDTRQDDPCLLTFTCNYTSDDHQLLEDELLQLLKELRLIPPDTARLPLLTSAGGPRPSADYSAHVA